MEKRKYFKKKYRVTNRTCKTPMFFVEARYWFLPCWFTCYNCYWFDSQAEAEAAAERLINPVVKEY